MSRKLTTNGWIKKLEHLQRDLILKETKYKCIIEGCTRRANVVDHLFSRNHKALFFYRNNLNPLCGGCHTQKTFGQGTVSSELFFRTRKRIGEEAWIEMLDLLKKPFTHHRKTWYLEEVEKRLDSSI